MAEGKKGMDKAAQAYFDSLAAELDRAYDIANRARRKRLDPAPYVEITPASDVAARVEGIVGPKGIAGLIRQLEGEGHSRSTIAHMVVEKIAGSEFDCGIGKSDRRALIGQAVRTGVGILTEGVLVAPTEGISGFEIRQNPDGSDYLAIFFAGPIRSAGGTVAALAVVLGDVARKMLGVGDFRPTDTWVERYVEEITVYGTRSAHLQYKPSDDEIRHLVRSCPVCIDGDPTEKDEVAVNRDVPGIGTNRVRSGIALVICEGIAQKAAKVSKYTKKIKLDWNWLEPLIKVARKEGAAQPKPDFRYLEESVAGRAVFSYPSTKGGWRLRYGRSRASGIMGKAVHPASMIILDSFLAIGTQMKVERPGKSTVVTSCDSILGPVVKLSDGSVAEVRSEEEAKSLVPKVKSVLFLGDMLVSVGDFLKSNHPLIPGAWCEERFELEAKKAGAGAVKRDLSAGEAVALCRKHNLPLHPRYTYFWHDISQDELLALASWLRTGKPNWGLLRLESLELESSPAKSALESLCVPHSVDGGRVRIGGEHAYALLKTLGILVDRKITGEGFDAKFDAKKGVLENLSDVSGMRIMPKCPTYIGSRMGRPEKARERKMKKSVNSLFPVGIFADKNSSVSKSYAKLKSRSEREGRGVDVEVARLRCRSCGNLSISPLCACGGECELVRTCTKCGRNSASEECAHCGAPANFYDRRNVDLVSLFERALSRCALAPSEVPDVKGVAGMMSESKMPEPLEKGVLRARQGVFVFRDGTCRFDATDIPLTHFTPKEMGTAVSRLRELGYLFDKDGKPLEKESQVVPLMPQDIILSDNGAEYLIKVGKFVDDELERIYGMEPYYRMEAKGDLIGRLVIGLSPHTSAGVLARVVGFTPAHVGFAHPYFHTAKRRNCFAGETKIPVLENGEWKITRISELVRNNLKQPQADDFGASYSQAQGLSTLAFNQKSKAFELAKISHVSLHAPRRLVALKTKSGREICVTPDHPFPSRNGKKKALELEEALLPLKFCIPEKDILHFELAGNSDDVMAKLPRDILSHLNKRELAGKLGIGYKTLTNYCYRRSYPLWLAKGFAAATEIEGCRISAKRDTVALPWKISCSEDFMFLIGAYMAEGHARARKGKKGCYQVGFAAQDGEVRRLFARKIKRVFGITPTTSAHAATICSRILHSFFIGLGVGKNAREKSIPGFALSLPKSKARAMLSGLFAGDGSVSLHSTLEVNLSSVSKSMLDQVSFLLSSYGIKHSFSVKDDGKPEHAPLCKIRIFSSHAKRFIDEIGFACGKQRKAKLLAKQWSKRIGQERTDRYGDAYFEDVSVHQTSRIETVYSLTVEPHHTVVADGFVAHQCDGDEDTVILLMDGLLNFSRQFLPESRGGTMDAPLVLTTELDPSEVDDEVHSMEIAGEYPLELYELADRFSPPSELKIDTVKKLLGKPAQYGSLPYTHESSSVSLGPHVSTYLKFSDMAEKVEAQFALQEKLRAVDAADAADRLLLHHFLPDMYGNLRSFSQQEFRCLSCKAKYRRVPLSGKCNSCGGKLLLTINKGGVIKYLKHAEELVERYHLPLYMKQRIELFKKDVHSIFTEEIERQKGLADFM